MFGPQRVNFAAPDAGVTGQSGTGRGTAGVRQKGPEVSETMKTGTPRAGDSEAMQMDEVPEKYRGAVKRYFSGEKE